MPPPLRGDQIDGVVVLKLLRLGLALYQAWKLSQLSPSGLKCASSGDASWPDR